MTALIVAAILSADPALQRLEVQVDGASREALVWIPDAASEARPAPVIFAFHGHGGSMRNAARTFGFEKVWPEAVVVYMQGLKTATRRDPRGEKPGWQNRPGILGDRDLKAFDAFLALVRTKTAIDGNRVYATGHSNGGGFTYALWSARADVLAAFAPSSANPRLNTDKLEPRPVFHVSGKADALVAFEAQARTVESARRVNGCSDEGAAWATGCTSYHSAKDAPVVWMVHEGGHRFPDAAPPLMVRFFKEHVRKATAIEPPPVPSRSQP